MERIYLRGTEEHFDNNPQALFLSGPRQVGKTTIAKEYLGEAIYSKYLNWDNLDHRQLILKGPGAVVQGLPLNALIQQKPVICFDEIHKFKDWKTFLKGFIDTYRDELRTLVTGSARLDLFSKSGDSLMGRYFLYRVHPLSVGEIVRPSLRNDLIGTPKKIEDDLFDHLLMFGGFPDPFLKGEQRYYRKWQNLRHKQFFQEDIQNLSNVQEISLMEVLANLLKHQAGQLTNYHTLSQKVRVTDTTIRRWISVFESLFFCFTIHPWSKNVARSLLKRA